MGVYYSYHQENSCWLFSEVKVRRREVEEPRRCSLICSRSTTDDLEETCLSSVLWRRGECVVHCVWCSACCDFLHLYLCLYLT